MCSVSLRTVDFLGHQWFQEFCLQNRITEDVKTSLMETHFTCLKQLKKLYFQSLQNSSLTLVTHDQTDDQMPLKLSRTAQRFGADILDVKCNFSPSPKSIPSTAPLLMVEQLVPPERNSNLHRLPPPAINFDFASAISSTILMLNSADSYPNRLPGT